MGDNGLTEDDIKPGNTFNLRGETIKPTSPQLPKKKKKGAIERLYSMMYGHQGKAGEYYT